MLGAQHEKCYSYILDLLFGGPATKRPELRRQSLNNTSDTVEKSWLVEPFF